LATVNPLIFGRIGGSQEPFCKPICPKLGASAVHVNELLSADGQHWDDGALEENLLYMNAQAVRRIPLGRLQHDFSAWAGERHGVYSVCSAYRLQVEKEMQDRDHGGGTTTHSAASHDPHWQRLWKCKVQPNVKVFWWRVSHDFIPSVQTSIIGTLSR